MLVAGMKETADPFVHMIYERRENDGGIQINTKKTNPVLPDDHLHAADSPPLRFGQRLHLL